MRRKDFFWSIDQIFRGKKNIFLIQFFLLIFFLTFFFRIYVFASADSFVFLKQKAQQDKILIGLGYENQKHIIKKIFESEDSNVFDLSVINQKFLSELIQEKEKFFSLSNEIIFDVQKMLEIDIWDFLENSQGREYGVSQYLLMTQSSLQKAQQHEQFLLDSLNALEENIDDQKKKVKLAEEQFTRSLQDPQNDIIEIAKQDLLAQSLILKKMEADFVQKKTHYKMIAPAIKNLQKKITAVEENRDALIKNVKTQKNSGLFIGVVEDK